MKATIEEHKETLTYTVRIYDENGACVFTDWCGSYRMAEITARRYDCENITNI